MYFSLNVKFATVKQKKIKNFRDSLVYINIFS